MSTEPVPPGSGECESIVAAAADKSGALCHIAALLDALHCGAMLMDRNGRITYANCRLCEMTQRACGELVGQSVLDLYSASPGRAQVEDALANFDQARERESVLPRADGSHIPVIISGRRLDGAADAGALVLGDHRIVTVIDISQQKQAEEDVQQNLQDMTRLSNTVLEQALELKRYSHQLEERVQERTVELREANMEAIYMLAVASETKDQDTGAHVRRIENYTRRLARELGLPSEEAERMAYSSILHDVGKIQVPDEVLRKPAALNDHEWKIMRQHTVAGERILSRKPFFDVARTIARSHHENWDGSGYPDGLSAAGIPLAARIVRVADVYDALTSIRPYKPAWSPDDAAREIERGQGKAFDPDVVLAFLRLRRAGRLTDWTV